MPASARATGSSGSGRTRSGSLELLLAAAKLGAIFCPANWRQTADELAFVIDDLEPRIVVWQERGDRRRRARGPRVAASADTIWIQPRRPTSRTVTRRSSPAARRTTPMSTVDPAARCCSSTPRRSGAGRTGRCSRHTALHRAGARLRALHGRRRPSDVYLNCGPLFHLGTFMNTLATFVAGGTNVFTPPRRRRGAVPRHRRRAVHRRVPRRADRSSRSSR